jgi:hypothetical protein
MGHLGTPLARVSSVCPCVFGVQRFAKIGDDCGLLQVDRRNYIPHQGAPPRRAWEAPAKWPPNPRAYLFGARAASAVRTLLGPALGDAASCPPCLGCPRVSSRSPLHARGALQGRPRGRALASTCMSWQLDAADAGSARPTAHPAERV